jgi:putative peptidoglycan lipid II flippase
VQRRPAACSPSRWWRRCSSAASSTPSRSDKTALALRGYGCGLLGLIGVKILAPGFYARQDLRTPVKIAVVVLVLTQAMNLAFVPLFGHAGLALSVGLGALVNALWLFVGLRRGGWFKPEPGWGRFALTIGIATLLMGGLLWAAQARIDWVGLAGHEWLRIGWLAACLGAAACCTSPSSACGTEAA